MFNSKLESSTISWLQRWVIDANWMDVSWNFERIWTKQKREYATEEKNFNKNGRLYLIFMGMSLSFKM